MKKPIYFLLFVFLMVLVHSCTTVNIIANKQTSYTKKPKKIYIVGTCSKIANVFCTGLINGLKPALNDKGILVDGFVSDPLSLETEQDINKKIAQYDPQAVLRIQQTANGSSVAVFELTLIDSETSKNVWKGELQISADQYSSIEDVGIINKAVKQLLTQLSHDDII